MSSFKSIGQVRPPSQRQSAQQRSLPVLSAPVSSSRLTGASKSPRLPHSPIVDKSSLNGHVGSSVMTTDSKLEMISSQSSFNGQNSLPRGLSGDNTRSRSPSPEFYIEKFAPASQQARLQRALGELESRIVCLSEQRKSATTEEEMDILTIARSQVFAELLQVVSASRAPDLARALSVVWDGTDAILGQAAAFTTTQLFHAMERCESYGTKVLQAEAARDEISASLDQITVVNDMLEDEFRRLTTAVNVAVAAHRQTAGQVDRKAALGNQSSLHPDSATSSYHSNERTLSTFGTFLSTQLGLRRGSLDDNSESDSDVDLDHPDPQARRRGRKAKNAPSTKLTINNTVVDNTCLPVIVDSWKPGVFDDIMEELDEESDLDGSGSGSDNSDALSDFSDAFSLTVDPVSAESSLWDVYGEFAATPHAAGNILITGRHKSSIQFNIPSAPQSPLEVEASLRNGKMFDDALEEHFDEHDVISKTVSVATAVSNIHEDDEYGYDEMSEGEVEDADSRVPVLLQDSRAEKIAQNLYYMQSELLKLREDVAQARMTVAKLQEGRSGDKPQGKATATQTCEDDFRSGGK